MNSTQDLAVAAQEMPWQLRMFRKTLKKQQRFRLLRRMLGPIPSDTRLLLVTCGDNNGAMNWHLRELGGHWTWADLEDKSIKEMSALLGNTVHHVSHNHLPFEDGAFDCVVTIDVHEHLTDPEPFTKEVVRVAGSGGRVIVTVPSGEGHKLVNIVKNSVGMTKEEYGHARDGYSISELTELVRAAELEPIRARTFSKFFTETIELALNFAYVKKMAKKTDVKVEKGTIAPATSSQLKSVSKAYRLYSWIYPFVWLFSKLDLLLFFSRGYVVMIECRKR